MKLNRWLTERREEIAGRWGSRIRDREERERGREDGFLDRFLTDLVRLIPVAMGPSRDEGEAAWAQATHLFGSFALHRGLAAGEVVEEMAFLREEILKLLLDDVSFQPGDRMLQRDLLALNRVLDQGAVRASVAYVDDLFFAHLQGSGVPEEVTPELEEELGRQLAACWRDLEAQAGRDHEGSLR